MENDQLKVTKLERERKRKTKDNDSKLFTPFITERMEDYAALSLAALIIILVLIIHQ